ncbi:hypothetical protein TRFO_13671 [Tritrichomonas foetus]|uniref:Protein kinase domain-containing protein n=1 Tax=Tritrichomonas foetus TaxID=1144522 RepID=A0A1J4L1T8_9EUKA|nr:hypothetical protein TRFO_13671 [Tritrichomonas foetus]|eukprot:OHT15853.1 hypothetical protein TRFO_13671 [Tritrichomonas foetus]
MSKVQFGGVLVNDYQITSTKIRNSRVVLSNAVKDGKNFMLKFTTGYNELYFIDNFQCSTVVKPIEHFFYKNKYVSVFPSYSTDLYDFVAKNSNIPLEKTLQIIEDCFSAVYYLHNCSVLHNNIKLENFVIYDEGNGILNTKIRDFQGAVILDKGEKCTCQYGTPGYMAPEFHEGHSFPSDIYALGVTLRYLWYRTKKTDTYANQINVSIIDSLLERMVKEDPNSRPTAQECYSIIYYNINSKAATIINNQQLIKNSGSCECF